MEFDDLKRVWRECDRRLNTTIHLNTGLLRSSILGNSDADLNRLVRCDVDFTAPVIVVQKKLESLGIERRRANKWMAWLSITGEEMVEKLQTTALRVLRRHRVLRG
jgi:hypothetical protein